MRRTNLDSLRSCLYFRVFRSHFASDFFNLLLVRFYQAEIIVVNMRGFMGGARGPGPPPKFPKFL